MIETIYINDLEDFNDLILNQKYDYYRGEASAAWHLHASLLRKEQKYMDRSVLDDLMKDYKELYDRVISSRHSFSRFLFYLQHEISYSPFIDLSKNPWVALSFCLESIQRNTDQSIKEDAGFYTFKWVNKENHWLKTHEAITDVLDKLKLNDKKQKPIEPYIIDSNDLNILNDRMQYQQGAFLLLNDDYLGENLIYNNEAIDIKKFILSPELQKDLFFILREKHVEYTIDYLYDPYRLFKKKQSF